MSNSKKSFKILVFVILILFVASTIMMFLPVFTTHPPVEQPQISVQAIDANGEETDIKVEAVKEDSTTKSETNTESTPDESQTTESK